MVSNENGSPMVMPVSPMYGNGGGFGDFGGSGWWILLLFILLGGWNNGGMGGFGGDGLYPWMNQSNQISGGFRDQMLSGTINGIQSAITSGFGDVQNALCSGFAQAEIAANGRQMADMNQNFALQSQLANCCCENRLATADLKYAVATENCADRTAAAQNTRDIMENCNRNNQAILDKLCQLELDGKNDRIADLERQLTMANLNASQTAQTARILADNAAQTTALEQYLNPVPIPAYQVQNPNCCGQGFGCGCGA